MQEIGQKVAMHAVAMKPRYLSPESVPAEALEGDTAHTACMLACIKSQSPIKACISPEGSVASRGRMRLSWVAWVPRGGKGIVQAPREWQNPCRIAKDPQGFALAPRCLYGSSGRLTAPCKSTMHGNVSRLQVHCSWCLQPGCACLPV